MKKFSEEDMEKMKEMYIQGLSYEKIAKNFNCSIATVFGYLKSFIQENPRYYLNKKKEFSKEDIQEMEEMYIQGLSYEKLPKNLIAVSRQLQNI